MDNKQISFEAEIKQNGTIDAAYIVFPFDTIELFGKKGQVKVRAIIDTEVYRGSLTKMGFNFHFLGITKEIRKKIGKTFGDTVTITLEEDTEPRVVEIPDYLQKALDENSYVAQVFSQLSYSNKREYVLWLGDTKREETRQKRIAKLMDVLSQKKLK